MSGVAGEVRTRSLSGVRGVLALNLATLPLSFVTNALLGRASPEALGAYGAIQVLLGGYFVFLFPGGAAVFNRFVPALPPQRRWSFITTYSALALGLFAAAALLPALAAPGLVRAALERFGSPSPGVVAAFLAAALVWGLLCYFLYALHRPIEASGCEKLVVAGYFLVSLLAFRSGSVEPAWLWSASVAVYGAAAAAALALVLRVPEFHRREGPALALPATFWRVAAYAHVDTVVGFVYASLAPAVVLLWLALSDLGYFHAAMRYVLLAAVLPTTVAAALGPGLSRLVAAGLQEEACRQSAAAMRASILLLGPAAMALACFATPAMAVFGPGFADHSGLLRLLAPAVLAGPVVMGGNALAVALGEFGAWLRTSAIYAVAAVVLLAAAVPALGLAGAALATTAGALLRQELVLRMLAGRAGLPRPPRIALAWVVTGATAGACWAWDPGLPGATACFVAGLAVFLWRGKVRLAEVAAESRRLVRGTA
jgi:O-antigen/teichoic acid export membrane protein